MACLFCRIAAGEIPANILFRDDDAVAFSDLNPQAPHHALVIPVKHIATPNDITPTDAPLLGHLVQVASALAGTLGLQAPGWRLVMNCNADGGQTVFHIHMHILGGRRMAWPPG